MKQITTSVAVPAASADRLWTIVSDIDAWADLLPTVEAVRRLDGTVGSVDVGQRFVLRQPGLPESVYEVIEWSAGSSFTWAARSPGVVTTAGHVVDGDADGSHLHLSLEWTGPLSGIVGLLLTKKAGRMVESEAETFARVAQTP